VERRLPRLAAVRRDLRRLADAAIGPRDPRALPQHGALRGRLGPAQRHLPVAELALEDEELAAIRDPALVPDSADRIVRAQALADEPAHAAVVLAQRAPVEDRVDVHARSRCGLARLV